MSLFAIGALALASISFPAPTRAQMSPIERPVDMAAGFNFNKFAEKSNVPEFHVSLVSGPTSMAFDPRGRLFVSTLAGRILILLDNDDDGRADQVKVYATQIPSLLGITFRSNGDLYATSSLNNGTGRILRLPDRNQDDVPDSIDVVIDGLPSEGNHQTARLRFGPDGLLYFGQGSSTDRGTPNPGRPGERPLNASIIRIDVDNPQFEVVATGLRNPFGIAFHPENGELFSTDAGSGEICQFGNCGEDLSPPEEINWIRPAGNYGFPLCEGNPTANPNCLTVSAPIHTFLRHLTPTSVTFYTGPQAGEFRNLMLVTLLKKISGVGGDLRLVHLEGDPEQGFRVTQADLPIARFNALDPFDGPIDTVIDPLSGDIYVARLDIAPHADSTIHHNYIYRIYRQGANLLPFIGPLRPSSVRAGSGALALKIMGRRLKAGAVVLVDGQAVPTRQGETVFDLVADLPASATATERTLSIEVRNPDGTLSNRQTLSVTKTGEEEPGPKTPQLTSMFVFKKKVTKVINPVRTKPNANKFRLAVTGADFEQGAQLLVNGTPLELVSSSATELIGRFGTTMLSTPGELTVQVRNPSGRVSNILRLTVTP